ncbi:MAG: glycosyltransferase family 2 protein [Lachnospiraceae bacterium]|nr:glycosyltransferase family 2 protein [Lachnospiraceae bacterium]
MVTFSLCMIVKNEEKILARCLDSLKGLMDEIIIVDTGSTDHTIEIARTYTDHIYTYSWENDFSKARNFAFSKATMDYIYSADADELLDMENQKRFQALKKALLPEIEIVQMYYCNQFQYNTTYNYDKEYRPKLFKRQRSFHWIEPIHETIALDPVVYDSDICITHLPESNHAPRDLRRFVQLFEEHVRLSTHLHNMYARELFIAGTPSDFTDAIPVFEDSMMDTDRTADEIREATCVLVRAYHLGNHIHGFFTNALKNIAGDGTSEVCYELGLYYSERKEWQEAAIWYENAAYETECVLNLCIKEHYALEGLADCYDALGNPSEAILIRSKLS